MFDRTQPDTPPDRNQVPKYGFDKAWWQRSGETHVDVLETRHSSIMIGNAPRARDRISIRLHWESESSHVSKYSQASFQAIWMARFFSGSFCIFGCFGLRLPKRAARKCRFHNPRIRCIECWHCIQKANDISRYVPTSKYKKPAFEISYRHFSTNINVLWGTEWR